MSRYLHAWRFSAGRWHPSHPLFLARNQFNYGVVKPEDLIIVRR